MKLIKGRVMLRSRFGLCCLLALFVGCDSLPGKPDPANAPKRPEQITDFNTLFGQNCAGCHGADGKLGPAPPLNDAVFLAIVPDDDDLFRQVITYGRPSTAMPAFDREHGGTLTEDQVRILAAGIKTRWQSQDSKINAKDYPAYFEPFDAKGYWDDGAKVFATACAGCHGDKGQGATVNGKRIGAINEWAFLSLTSEQALRRYIITGRPDLGMPSSVESAGRPSDFKPLTSQQVTELVVLLSTWRKEAAKGR